MYSVAILCGGESKRMGQDKKFLDWHGTPLLTHMLRGFSGCGDLFLSVRQPSPQLPPDVPAVPDEYPGCGPLAGLHASLRAAKKDILFAVSCDAPLVDRHTADALLPRLGSHDAVVPQMSDGRVHPLAALYRRETAPVAEHLLQSGIFRLRDFLEELDIVYVPTDIFPWGDVTFANLNTHNDIDRLNAEIERLRSWTGLQKNCRYEPEIDFTVGG